MIRVCYHCKKIAIFYEQEFKSMSSMDTNNKNSRVCHLWKQTKIIQEYVIYGNKQQAFKSMSSMETNNKNSRVCHIWKQTTRIQEYVIYGNKQYDIRHVLHRLNPASMSTM